ncbi:MAG TPA: M20/M25/M40 family metallo-hydrolase [Longimicrobiaceae bacterium]|nr:M20/M25/M40 family metallo-hydrolase [Longimicrobiaceae bacterium]
MRRLAPPLVALGLLVPVAAPAQMPRELPMKWRPRATVPAITSEDLMSRLYAFADDSLMGRAVGTPYNLKGAALIERELRRLGLRPAGENGTFYQDVPLIRRVPDARSALTVDGQPLRIWADYFPRDQGPGARPIDGAEVVYGGVWGDEATLVPPEAAAGKVVVIAPAVGADGAFTGFVPRSAVVGRYAAAAGILVAQADHLSVDDRLSYREASVSLGTGASASAPSLAYVTEAAALRILGADPRGLRPGTPGRILRGALGFTSEPVPGRNVVAVLPGSDPRLRGQYVALGAHNDHDPPRAAAVDHDSLRIHNRFVRPGGAETPDAAPTAEQRAGIRAALDSLRRSRPPRRDSIYNGADDDASGSMGLLEVAEAMAGARRRPRRSVLFVWHTGEESGMLGSRYFTDHPTVPLDSVVAQLNVDMIGRGARDNPGKGPLYMELIGSRRLSTELGDLVEAVNRTGRHGFAFDYTLDADGHPANIYCRSDHWLYARHGIPIAFFSTGGHQDYHMVTDEPQYIDFEHYRRSVQLIHDVAVRVSDLDHRVAVDKPKPDPNAPCRQ